MFLPPILVLSLSLQSSALLPPSPPRRSINYPISSSLRNAYQSAASLELQYKKKSSVVLFSYAGNGDNPVEEHLQGIGVGIDLGTTNSAVAMMIRCDNKVGVKTMPAMIEIQGDERTMPSVVSFVPDSQFISNDMTKTLSSTPVATFAESIIDIKWPSSHQIVTGDQALQFEQQFPQTTYRNVKRVIGTGGKMASLAMRVVPNLFISSLYSDKKSGETKRTGRSKTSKWKQRKKNELPKLHKQLEDAIHDPALLTFQDKFDNNDQIMLRPEQISACILRKLYDVAELHHQTNQAAGQASKTKSLVTRAVIGVPAYFTEAQRKATIRASELAGVPKVKLLPEPEAAALAYGISSSDKGVYSKEELILVFDLGGGTFDVSVLEVGGGVTEVLATVGNNRLGGTDFDKRVAEYLSKQAVEYARKMMKNKMVESESIAMKSEKTKQRGTRDLYANGSGAVPDMILRVAEEARKNLSNQKSIDVLVPLIEDGWKKIGGTDFASGGHIGVIGPIDSDMLQAKHNMVEGEDYIIVPLDRKLFEQICVNELQLLLQPIREVAIMAGVLLPGEARPSFVETALAMARAADEEDGEEFWDLDDVGDALVKTSKAGVDGQEDDEEEVLSDQALQQIDIMDLKAKKKEQQRGRKKARDIDKRERSFRKQKRTATEDATMASLLGKRSNKSTGSSQTTSVSTGNEKVQEGIHGRPLSRIVLVGGATRMPVIGKLLEAVVGIVPQRTVNPDEAVAIGCAIQCGILDGENEGLLGGMQAVLSPMQAAVMRALAKKRGMEMMSDMDEDEEEWEAEEVRTKELMMMGGGSLGGISGLIVDQFDDEDDFY
ncbi:hypothetical protein HJC23_011998 [Cyclotella cryptica]|uniref:Heat shock protein 70 n=1 Tax=Cyclotella cryptica TaxID=29204 RepID=A0ABD3QQI8_9STRA|eukprot:CCRYP_003071-RA/>CCRYP_003071-RA protein AED:0.06 eAED:0.06 QI:205/1/1/1/0.75/0.4/5/1755/831